MPYQAITPEDMQCRTYSADETSRILGVGRRTLINNAHAGKLDHLRPIWIGHALRFPRFAVDAATTGETE